MKKTYLQPAISMVSEELESMICASVEIEVNTGGTPTPDDDGTVWFGARGSVWDD